MHSRKKFQAVGILGGLVAGLFAYAAFADVTGDILPFADGAYTAWTPSTGTAHYALVDESSCNGTTDYVYTTTVGNRDAYKVSLSSVPNYSTITGVHITPCASRNSNGGSSTMNVFYRFNGADSSDAGNYALTGTTPVSLATTAWSGLSLSKVSTSALEIGAVLSAGTKGARLSRIAVTLDYNLPSAPAAPSSLTASTTIVASSTNIVLNWTDNSLNEEWFIVERSTDNINFSQIGTAVSATYTDFSMTPGTYYYRVAAHNAGGNSGYSNTASATVVSLPNAPSNLSATPVASSQMNLAWQDNSDNEDGFRVERSPNGVSSWSEIGTTGAGVISYSDTCLPASATRYYRVRAYNVAGNSAYSATTTGATGSLPAPSGLGATNISGTQNDLSWTDNSSDESGFGVFRSLNNQFGVYTSIATTSAGAVSYSDTGASANQTYYYKVRAIQCGGSTSSFTAIVYAITATVVPNVPSNFTAMASTTTAFLNWTDNSTNEENFRIERGTDGVNFSEIAVTAHNIMNYTDPSLASGTYYYRMRASNAVGNSDYATTTSVIIP